MSSSEMALSDSEGENVSPKIRKKGVVNDHLYPRNIRKQARLSGQSYVNEKGVTVPAKTIPTLCG